SRQLSTKGVLPMALVGRRNHANDALVQAAESVGATLGTLVAKAKKTLSSQGKRIASRAKSSARRTARKARKTRRTGLGSSRRFAAKSRKTARRAVRKARKVAKR